MKITLNGNEKSFSETLSLEELVNQFRQDHRRIIAEVNEEIIHTSDWSKKRLSDGDKVELVNFVGGG